MGQKTHPYGFRLGVIKPWKSKWYEDRNYATWLHQDLKLKETIKKKFAHAGIADIEIERAASKVKVVIYTSRPGIIIGKRGAGVEQLRTDLQKLTESELFVDIQEVRKAETNAQLVAESIATQLERRVAFRRALKKAVSTAMKFGVKGIRVNAGGRLGGAEITPELGTRPEGSVIVGLRPQNIRLAEGDSHRVELSEQLGGVAYHYLTGPDGSKITVEAREQTAPKPGSMVGLGFDAGDALYFDGASEERLR